MGIGSPSLCSPSITSVHRCFVDWLGAHLQELIGVGMGMLQKELHKCVRDEGNSPSFECFRIPNHGGVSGFMSDSATVGKGHGFLCFVQFGTRNAQLDRAVHGLSHSQVHSRKANWTRFFQRSGPFLLRCWTLSARSIAILTLTAVL